MARVPQAEPAPEQSTWVGQAFIKRGKSLNLTRPLAPALSTSPQNYEKYPRKSQFENQLQASNLVFYARFSLCRTIGTITS